jgi:hypothetical protein
MTTTLSAPAGPRSGVRGWVVLGLVLLAGTVLLTWANLDRAGSTEPLHPENPGEEGTRAVARVLEQQGVAVDVVESDEALGRATLDDDTTLVVTSTSELGTSTYAGLRDAASAAGTTVLVSPPDPVLDQLGVAAHSASPIGGSLEAECDQPLLEDLGLEAGGTPYDVDDGTACFRSGPGAELPGLVATTGRTVLVGAPSVLTNDAADEADHAAIALRLLGQHPRLVWYVPTADDLAVGDERADASDLADVVPDWLVPSLLLLAITLALFLFWQGRRFGPLVVEPLPVVVRADETEASRGRLYRSAKARPHAAAALRADARAELRARHHLPPTTTLDALLDHLASLPGAPDRQTLRGLLEDGPVPDDRALLRLAADLAALTDPTAPRKDRP